MALAVDGICITIVASAPDFALAVAAMIFLCGFVVRKADKRSGFVRRVGALGIALIGRHQRRIEAAEDSQA